MPEPILVPIGAFPEGMDSLHAEDDPVFNPVATASGFSPPRRCVAGINVDFDDSGRPQWRAGTELLVAATAGLNVFSGLGMWFYQDEGVIKRVTGTDPFTSEDVKTGLNASAKVEFHEYESWILWTNGLVSGKIDSDGAYQPWSLAMPPAPTLGQTAGSMESGLYLVACLFEDANGIEHAAGPSASIALTTGAITVTLSAFDSEAATVRVFCSPVNGEDLFFVGEAVPGAFPITITAVDISDEPLRTQGFSPVIPGDGVFSYQGQVVTFNGRYLQPSFGQAIHLFELYPTEESRPSNILSGAGVASTSGPGGFWVVCERGAYFTQGGTSGSWMTTRKDSLRYAKGALVLSGGRLLSLDVADEIALFVSEHGLMAGTADGRLIPLSEDRQRLDVVGKEASIVYREGDNFPQILFSLE